MSMLQLIADVQELFIEAFLLSTRNKKVMHVLQFEKTYSVYYWSFLASPLALHFKDDL